VSGELLRKRPEAIRGMFARVAERYDLLNHLLSGGLDLWWRRVVARRVEASKPKLVLDACTGTGDLAFALSSFATIVGSDFCLPMLVAAARKVEANTKEIRPFGADSLQLPLRQGTVDVVTVAFGVRNFEDLDAGLAELVRVLRPRGRLLVLEFSLPKGLAAPLLNFWSRRILPRIGRLISKDPEAYTYLPESISRFPEGAEMCERLRAAGLDRVSQTPLTSGVATVYEGIKLDREDQRG
jgi:demethylmenaquinone methyltransferase/2-methoxy-6-polyprenyl-1,4-benzoquinol methylase